MKRTYLRFLKNGWKKLLCVLCAVAVFSTTYMLILPAITLDRDTAAQEPGMALSSGSLQEDAQQLLICAQPEHQHDEACYTQVLRTDGYRVLVCPEIEHAHTEDCYDGDGELVCAEPEHTHDDNCYLTVALGEEDCFVCRCGAVSHAHTGACFNEDGEAVCGCAEHTHTEDCIDEQYETDGLLVYTCGLFAHTHEEACYDEAGELICTLLAHTHSEDCTAEITLEYETVLSCGLEEHAHGEACYTAAEPAGAETVTAEPDDNPAADEDGPETAPESSAAEAATLGVALRSRDRNDPDSANLTSLNVYASFRDGAIENENGDYVWTADASADKHAFIYRVTYSMSGLQSIPADSVKIRLPASILKDLNGDPADTFEISLPEQNDPLTSNITWVYKVDDSNGVPEIVVYNRSVIPSAEQGYFEISYKTKYRTFSYADYDPEATDATALTGHAHNASDPFTVTIACGERTGTADAPPVCIDTTAKVTSAEKTCKKAYNSWQQSWGEAPADAANYRYLIWRVKSVVINPTQAYDLSLADTFSAPGCEVVGFRMAGERVFKSAAEGGGVARGLTADTRYGRYDEVLTRYLASEYEDLDYYRLTNYVDATVTPAQGVDDPTMAHASGDYIYEDHPFVHPVGRFYAHKYGLYSGNNIVQNSEQVSNYQLTEFHERDIDEIANLQYYTYLEGYPGSFTVPRNMSTEEPENYWKVPVTYTLSDWEFALKPIEEDNDGYVPLEKEDYEITEFRLEIQEFAGAIMGETNNFGSQTVAYSDDDIVYLDVAVNGEMDSDEPVWNSAATLNLKTGAYWTNSEYIQSRSGRTFCFINNDDQVITGFRVRTTNPHYYTRIGGYPTIRLKDTSKVRGIVASTMQPSNQHVISVKNTSHSVVTQELVNWDYDTETLIPTGTEVLRDAFDKEGFVYAAGLVRHGEVTKSAPNSWNDTIAQAYLVMWEITADEWFKNPEGSTAYVWQNSGTLYDLLPPGGLCLEDTVTLYADEQKVPDSEYTIETIPNYKNTGRTLLMVHTDQGAYHYRMTFTSSHPWDFIAQYSSVLVNDVMYETGNPDLGEGSVFSDWVVSLDGTTAAGAADVKFVYDVVSVPVNAITSASIGLYKQVRARTDANYSYETTTSVGDKYSYKQHFSIADGASYARDIILYDSLENYIPAKDSDGGDWVGTMLNIDLTRLRELGCAPVLYYTENAAFDPEVFSVNYDFTADANWTEASVYEAAHADLSAVRGFAVDVRQRADGDPEGFILPPDKELYVVVHMLAPDTCPDVPDPVVYNNIHLYSTVYDPLAPELSESKLIYQDYTTVHLHVEGDLKLRKLDATDHDTAVAGVTFQLTGVSSYEKEYNLTCTTGDSGTAAFNNIEMGHYTLQEVLSPADYLLDPTPIYITIDGQGNLSVDNAQMDAEGYITSPYESLYSYDAASGAYIIVNEPRHHGDFSFLKTGRTSGSEVKVLLPGVRFCLEGRSIYGTRVLEYATSGANGLVSFTDIETGTYKMTEVSAPEGYIRSEIEYTVTIGENGLAHITYQDEETGETVTLQQSSLTGAYEIINNPLSEFTLLKTDAVNGGTLTGAQFHLTGRTYKNQNVDVTAGANDSGAVHFMDLEPGEYVLTETVAPEKYELDTTARAVIIAADGTVTIDGLSYDEEYKWYPFPNERKLDGTVRIIKVWNDAGYENERMIPTVNISATEPDFTLPVATIDRDKWKTSVCDGNSSNTNLLRTATGFVRSETPLEGGTRIDDGTTGCSVKVLKDGDTIYWWSDAEIVYLPKNCSELFKNANGITTLDLSGFNTSKVENMSGMFDGCSNLQSVNLSSFVTSNVMNMDNMFNDCTSLTSLDLRNFDTSSVTSMKAMFNNCRALTDLNVTSFDTSKVTNMNSMFAGCSSLTALDLTHFNTSSVTDMANMFSKCSSLTDLDVTRFDTSNVTTMNNMFSKCSSLTSLDLSHFKTSNVTNMANMFSGCSSLTDLDVSHFNTSSVTTMASMFSGCSSLTDLDLTSFNTSSVTDMSSMFNGCSSLNDPDLTSFNTSNVTNMSSMFCGCSGLTDLDVTRFNTSSVTNMESMFKNCSSLTSLDVTHFNTSNVMNMNYMFENCSSLTSLDVTHFDTSKVISMSSMFKDCASLTDLDVTHFDTSKVIGISSMFQNCTSLTNLDVSRLDTSKCQSLAEMFSNCEQLTSLDVSHLDTSQARSMANMFSGCKRLGNLDLSHFDTSVCHTFNQMFQDCDAMTRIDCSSFNLCATRQSGSSTTQVGYISLISMFADCDNVTDIVLKANDVQKPLIMTGLCQNCPNLKNFTLLGQKADGTNAVVPVYSASSATSATSLQDVFNGCTSLEIADFTTIDSFKTTSRNQVVSTDRMFRNCSSLTELHMPNFSTAGTSAGRIGTAIEMFAGCSNLQKIWVNPTYWSVPSSTATSMFKDCVEIVGQNGTAYSSNYTGKTYARVDTPSTHGYFWDAANIVNDPTTGETVTAFTAPVVLGNLAPDAVVLIPPENAGTEDPVLIPPLDPAQAPVVSGEPGSHTPVQTDYTTRSVMWDASYGNPATARDCWIDNGDGTWTYRMPVFDEDNTYYGWEDDLPFYITDYALNGSDWIGGDSIRMEYTGNSTGDAGCVLWVRNARSSVNEEYSHLSVTKRLAALDANGNPTSVPEADKNVEFRFTVYLNQPLDGLYGNMCFLSGIATFTLKGDQTATAVNLPAGIEYRVEEEPVDGFTPTAENESGVIPGGTVASVTFTNTETIPETGSLRICKMVVPADDIEFTEYDDTRRFTFTVTLTDETPDQSLAPLIEGVHVFGSLVFTDGVAVTTLANDEECLMTGLPVGLTYTVAETPSDLFDTESQNDTGVIEADETEVATAEFTNIKTRNEAYGSFTVKKLVNGPHTDQLFTFWAQLSGLNQNEYYYTDDGMFTAEPDGTAFVEFSLLDNETFTFENLPVGAKYIVTEPDSGYTASFTVTEQNENGTIAVPSGSGTGDVSTGRETVDADEETLIVFTNTPPEYEVSFLKATEEKMGLAGARLQVLDTAGNVAAAWTSDGSVHTETLYTGTYVLHEARAPDGYGYAEDIPFVLKEDGTVYLLEDDGETLQEDPVIMIVMEDPPEKITFPKTGGSGTLPYILCGLGMMAAAWIYILLRFRKRGRGADF